MNVTFQKHNADSIKSKRQNKEKNETPLLNFDLENIMGNFLRVVSAILREDNRLNKQSQPVVLGIYKDRRQITAGQLIQLCITRHDTQKYFVDRGYSIFTLYPKRLPAHEIQTTILYLSKKTFAVLKNIDQLCTFSRRQTFDNQILADLKRILVVLKGTQERKIKK